MHSIKLTRCYLNYRSLNLLTNVISSGDCFAEYSKEATSKSQESSEELKGSADIFGNLSAKTEEQKLSKLVRLFNKSNQSYQPKSDNLNRGSSNPSTSSNRNVQEDVCVSEKTKANKSPRWKKAVGDGKISNKHTGTKTDPSDLNDTFGNLYPENSSTSSNRNEREEVHAFEKTKVNKFPRWKKAIGDGKNSYHKKISDKHTGTKTDPNDLSDTFGSLYPETRSDPDQHQGDEGDAQDQIKKEIQKKVYNKSTRSYGNDMYQLIQQNKLGEALILFKKMREIDMVKPDDFVYATLICGCGQKGFTSKAFKLFKEMKEHGVEVNNIIYTGLFNSCGNSPFPEYGLKQARQLFDRITDKQIALNGKNYHAAIKAFGRCGDLQTAFRLVDEMIQKELIVTTETFNFLLMGCVSDRQSGFLQAIRVWRKMKAKRLRPDVFSYNLLFRATRDCSLGKMELAERILLDTFNPDLNLDSSNLNRKYLTDSKPSNLPIPVTYESIVQPPDLLSVQPQTSNVMQLIEPKTPQERFALLGGLGNILKRMHGDRAVPSLRTFTELLELIPSDGAVEDDLLKAMHLAKVEPDVDFYNVLIKKRNLRRDFKGAKEVLVLIGKNNLYPDIATFGTLAIGCINLQLAQTFLNDLKEAGFRPNIEIMGALVHQGCYHRNFRYVIEMLKIIRMEKIKPSTQLIDKLEKCVSITKKYLVKQEKEGVRFAPDDPFIESFQTFLKFYKAWLKSCQLEMPEDPWASYRIPKNIEEIKERS